MNTNYDALAQDYAQHRGVHPGVLQHLIHTANLTRASRVLHVGCGTGNYLLALPKATGCSCLHLIPAQAFQRGIRRMERDRRAGPIPCVARYLLLWGTR